MSQLPSAPVPPDEGAEPLSPQPSPAQQPAPHSKSRWLTWLAILFGFAILVAILGILWYRSRHPLTATRLQSARQLWEQHGPQNYNLLIIIEGAMPGTYVVEVRHDRVLRAIQKQPDGRETDILTATLPDGRVIHREGKEWTIPGLFDWLERDLMRDLERDPRRGNVYTFVRFHPHYGHPVEYVRSEPSRHYRLSVQLTPLPAP